MNETGTRGHVYALTALVPLAWAVLLLFHPAPDADDIFGSLRQEADPGWPSTSARCCSSA
jgi:hypothetical protein